MRKRGRHYPYNNGLVGFRLHTQNAIDPMTFQTTLYDLLEVSPYASVRVIRAAYRCLAQCSHPDKHAGAMEAMAQQSRFNEAYAVLSDPVRRQLYDQSIGLPVRFQERRATSGRGSVSVSCKPGQSSVMRAFAFRPLI
jgi:DnaJ-class molecular chaperone